MTAMTTVQLITQNRGGPVDHAVEVAIELSRLGHHSHLIGPPGDYAHRLVDNGVEWTPAIIKDKYDVRGARTVRSQLTRIGPDVVHCHDRRAGLFGRTFRKRRKGACVYTLHGVPDSLAHLVAGNLAMTSPKNRDLLVGLAEHLLATSSGATTVVPCAEVADFAVHHLRIPAGRVVVVPNGVGPGWLERRQQTMSEVVTVAWLGVMQPVKRVPALVRAAAGVPGLHLILVGDGPERVNVEATVHGLADDTRVHLVGFRPNPVNVLDDADFLALPSAAEACPMAVLQAMARGLPVVASSVGGVPGIVRDGVDGILVPPGDDQALRRALARMAGDADLRRSMGDHARARIAEHFTTRGCVERLVEVYEAVAR